ncbi:MAG TPA: pyridoxal phosphate-dependent aminotransferase family protein [Bacteroidia bacterium]|nr:pyridoxal phosphate-dependent aminotransferase family protein [Bacteroidia bacterium]
MLKAPLHLVQAIEERKRKGLFRSLKYNYPKIDFSSNDYLGFSKNGLIEKKIQELKLNSENSGSTGSRLISGNSQFAEELENAIAKFHSAESALVFNSGYDANVGLLSSVATKRDLVLYDELIHASIHDGIRMGYAKHYKIRHNDIEHLLRLIERNKDLVENIFIVVESVYSMDGDCAKLKELTEICDNTKLFLIVDEAHAIGVFGKNGRGLCNELRIEDKCFARVYTYGKAMGCHGAAIVGSNELKDYLVNFARSFIYTTALPQHSLFMIKAAYELLEESKHQQQLTENITYFNSLAKDFIKSNSAIHCKLYPGNKNVNSIEERSEENDLFVKGIKNPTVKEGAERIRICLHAFNTREEINKLIKLINE